MVGRCLFAGCLRNEVRRTCNDMQQEIKSGVDVVEKKKSRKYTDRVENGIMNMRGKLSETRKLKERAMVGTRKGRQE